MAITIHPLGGLPGILRVLYDADVDDTLEENVGDGPVTIYGVLIDNSANAAITYVKFWDAVPSTITLGTTAPDMILPVQASGRIYYGFKGGIPFATAMTPGAVTTPGTAGVTPPASAATLTLFVK